MSEHRHQSHLTQKNKSFKGGRHASKGLLKKRAGGRVNKEQRKSPKNVELDGRDVRKLKSKQAKSNQRAEMRAKRRGIESGAEPPRVVGIVSLNATQDTTAIAEALVRQATDGVASPKVVSGRAVTVYAEKWKQRLSLLGTSRKVMDVLDVAKVSDVIIFVIPVDDGVDEMGQELVRLMKAQGCGTPIGVIADRPAAPAGLKKITKMRKVMENALEYEFGTSVRVVDGNNEQELLRHVCQIGCKEPLITRSLERGFVLAETPMQWQEEFEGEAGVLSLSGYVRGSGITANQLVHLIGYGDFKLHSIVGHEDPCPVKRRGAPGMRDAAPEGVLEVADAAKVPDLRPDVYANPLEGEQNVLNEDEEEDAMVDVSSYRRVPKGVSAYQASWIVEDDEDEDEISPSSLAAALAAGGMEAMDEDGMEMAEAVEAEEDEEEEEATQFGPGDGMDAEDIAEQLALERKRRREQEQEDVQFPDEVDTPLDTPARVAFREYRMLKSFRTSAWDPKENLPRDYARILQFRNFPRTQSRVVEATDFTVPAGRYVTLRICGVPQAAAAQPAWSLLAAVGLFEYEQKTSVVNFTLQRYSGYDEPVENGEELVFCYGFRRLVTRPLFSENSHKSNKHKLERFLHESAFSVASIYGPIAFPPANLLVFKQLRGLTSGLAFVGSGSLLSVDPDRIVVSRITLSGYPFKIIKKKAVVRFMFFNAEDIKYYKPVELRTKFGRSGHIIDSLGTHGYMKCRFDGQLMQHDTILLHLYKRVFPTWRATYWQPLITDSTELWLPPVQDG